VRPLLTQTQCILYPSITGEIDMNASFQRRRTASVLQAALARRESGINILLYGPPGTGKTSFAATLAARTGARLRPVAEADEEGGEPARHERLAGLRLAQRLAAPGNTLLLFDEAEDLFVRCSGGRFGEPVETMRARLGMFLIILPF
jgi:predicted AAA+ superfamily ATPase